jgi:uncharacterized protein YecT (DUF1311 family)
VAAAAAAAAAAVWQQQQQQEQKQKCQQVQWLVHDRQLNQILTALQQQENWVACAIIR